MCAELVRVGYGILEDLPVVNSQILYLKSGEIYWLGPHEVMRIQYSVSDNSGLSETGYEIFLRSFTGSCVCFSLEEGLNITVASTARW